MTLGGAIALPLALETPRRVRRVVVINSWMWASEGDPEIARIDRLVRSPLGRFLYRWLGGSARASLPHAFGDPRRLTCTLHWHCLQPLSSRRAREGTYALACALRGSDAHYDSLWQRRDILATLPLTLIWGERDPVLTRVHRDRWLQAFPAARRISVADAGHFVAEERPDVIIAALRDFPGDSPQEAACRTAREDPIYDGSSVQPDRMWRPQKEQSAAIRDDELHPLAT